MKKLSLYLAIFAFALFSVNSEPLSLKAQFVKGNISEKTSLIKRASGNDVKELAVLGINFVVENKDILSNDRDLCTLATSSVLALTQDTLNEDNPFLLDSLISIFQSFHDDTLKIAILDKIIGDENNPKKNDVVVSFINSSLKNTIEKKEKVSDVTKSALKVAGLIGNRETFRIVFNGWKLETWKQYNEIVENSLAVLAESNISEVLKVFSMSNSRDDLEFFETLEKNSKISQEFKAEVSENALSDAILSIENFENISQDQVSLQMKAVKVISDNSWTRAANLVMRTFSIAKEEYARKIITADEFISVIEAATKLSSPEVPATFSKYLETLNAGQEKGTPPEKAVVLSVIKSLGELGDKIAFDSLLYVTYLSYPEDVIAGARSSLAKLKW